MITMHEIEVVLQLDMKGGQILGDAVTTVFTFSFQTPIFYLVICLVYTLQCCIQVQSV